MAKKKISITFSNLNDAALQVKAEHIIESLTNNEYFTSPTPSLTEVQAALQEFTTAAVKAKEGARLDVSIKNDKKQILVSLLRTLALYVQFEGENNESALISSGFTLQKIPQPIGVLAKPKNFKVVSLHPGAVKVNMATVYGAKSYVYDYRVKGETTWQAINDTRVSILITNLTKATEYEFRAVAIGVHPERVYSDVLSAVVL